MIFKDVTKMFVKKFLTGNIISLLLIFGLQNVACAGIIKVEVTNTYGERILKLRENGDAVFAQNIPIYYLYTYNVDQLNGIEVENEQDVSGIHQAMVTAANAASDYYESMGHVLDPSDASRIYTEHDNSLENLLMCLNSAKK